MGWIRSYRRADFGGDLTAGLTVAVMLVPQAMAYALLAGLPPIVGLYASLVPLFAYALVGSSRQLAVGPVAMDSLLTASGVGALAVSGTDTYLALAVLLAGMVGVIQLGFGLARLGVLVRLLSHPVISGFTSAAAILIAFSQLKHLLGAPIPRSAQLHTQLADVFAHASEVHLPTLAIGVSAIAILVGLKRYAKRVPGALVVVVLGTVVTWALDLSAAGVSTVGEVPAGLPSLSWPTGFEWSHVGSLTGPAFTIALVGFMEAISVGQTFAKKNGYRLDANRELVGLGFANLGAFVTGAYPVTGGLSRTAVNANAGARTPLASVLTGVLVALALLFFTPLFRHLPNAVLSAIVMTAVFGLIDLSGARRVLSVRRRDAALLAVTFLSTLFIGITEGIVIGVVASLGTQLVRSVRPTIPELGRISEARYVDVGPHAPRVDGHRIVRFDASLFFANAEALLERVSELVATAEEPVHTAIIDASGMNDLDSSGATALLELHGRLDKADVRLVFAGVPERTRAVMERAGLVARLGEDRFACDVHAAVTPDPTLSPDSNRSPS